jgi:hypothetical protein
MSSDESLPDIFDEEQAREIIIDYVQTHPGCSKEEILKKQNKIGKKTKQNFTGINRRRSHQRTEANR